MVHYNIDKSLEIKAKRVVVKENNWNKRPRTKWLWGKFVDFCRRTDLHGYKYIVMEELHPIERSCWAFAVLMSIVTAIYFVVTAYKWYARNPIVTVIESTQGPIWDVPFPAVTICDLNVVSRKAARTFVNSLTLPANMTADFVFEIIRLVPLLHSSLTVDINQKEDLRKLQNILDLNNISIDILFRKLSPASACSDLVERCIWKNTVYRCNKLFHHVLTAMTLCCAFNYFAVEIDDNTVLNEHEPTAPRRVASCGFQTALTVLLHTHPEDYYSAIVASQGFLVFIDDAYNFPNLDSPVRMVNPSTEVLIAVSPERTYATSGIRDFSPEKRQCYYFDEMQFGIFRQYSFHNCMAYHKMEIIKNTCDCVPFFYPVKGYHRICNFNDLDCLEDLIKPLDGSQSYHNYGNTFNCLPECEHFDYPLEVALGALTDNLQAFNGLPFFNDLNLVNKSLLNVFFNDLVSTRYRRDIYLNWQNILAAFGGLLSLMLGFTLISGFDLILFIIFKVAYDSFVNLTYIHETKNKKEKKIVSKKIKVQESHKKETLNKSIKNDEMMARKQIRKW